MRNILNIARNTFKETIRDKILYTVTFLGILFIIFTFFLSTISLDQGKRVVMDFGLVGILIFGVAIAIFVGANLLYKEIVGGTAFILFSKPLSKSQYIIGKFLGLAMTILLATTILTIIFTIGFWLQNKSFPSITAYGAIVFSFLEILIIVSLSILFGSFTNPISSSLYSLALFFVGHSYSMLLRSAMLSGIKIVMWISKAVYYLLPNLEKFNLRTFATYSVSIMPTEIIYGFLYAFFYIAVVLFFAILAINKREF